MAACSCATLLSYYDSKLSVTSSSNCCNHGGHDITGYILHIGLGPRTASPVRLCILILGAPLSLIDGVRSLPA